MQESESQRPGSWQYRREEYLRASGRNADLVKEGYVDAGSDGKWLLIAGGRRGPSPKESRRFEPFIVEQGAS